MKSKNRKLSVWQIFFVVLGLLVFVLFTPIVSFVFNSGSAAGMALGIIIVLVSAFFPKIKSKIKLLCSKPAGKAITVIMALALLTIIIYCVSVTVLVMSTANTPSSEIPENTTAILLGCSVKGDKPSFMLQKRIDAAYSYLTENENAVCILSGGKGDDEDFSEAQAMFNSLTEKGISPERLIKEDRSTTTAENIEFSKEILSEKHLGSTAVIITTDFHQYRAGKMAQDAGLNSYAVSSRSGTFALPTFIVREWFTVLIYYINGK